MDKLAVVNQQRRGAARRALRSAASPAGACTNDRNVA
jgi:hypothetical protein